MAARDDLVGATGAAGNAYSPAFSRSAPAPISASAVYDQSAPSSYSQPQRPLGFNPVMAPAHQQVQKLPSGEWSYSNTSSSALLTLPAGVYDVRDALSWDGKSPRPAAIGPGGHLPHPHPLLPSYDSDSYSKREPAQQVPFGRLSALKPAQVYEREMREENARQQELFRSFPTASYAATYNRPGPEAHKVESAANSGKLSISRRLPEKTRLRYQLPGYCGWVRTIQFRHGDTFGRATRKALMDAPENV
jgi:hypothetical protein